MWENELENKESCFEFIKMNFKEGEKSLECLLRDRIKVDLGQ